MQQLPAGAMLAVPLPEDEVEPLLDRGLVAGRVNGPALCVVSGPTDAVDRRFRTRLTERRRRVRAAAYLARVPLGDDGPVDESFAERGRERQRCRSPQIPFVSNVTGTWITAQEATDPAYWARHLRQTVRFADGLQQLLRTPGQILLEVGPGPDVEDLGSTASRARPGTTGIHFAARSEEPQSDVAFAQTTLGQLWLAGVQVDWTGFYMHERRRRVPCPPTRLSASATGSNPSKAHSRKRPRDRTGRWFIPASTGCR